MPQETPQADIAVSHDLIHALLREFVPELADEPLEFHASGWDNEIHRVGEHHAVRLPRRTEAAVLIENEQRWLPEIAPKLPLPIPTPTHAGQPAFGFHWHWNVVPWLVGVPLAHAPTLDTDQLIDDLAEFLNALHVPAPDDAPVNQFRGVPLADRADKFIENANLLEAEDRDAVLGLWEELSDTPPWGGEAIWLHGDLHGLNMLVRGGRLSAVIDWGDITAGDPACDFAIAWMLFDEDARGRFRQALKIDGKSIGVHTWTRARVWAISVATAMLAHSDDNPALRRVARETLDRVFA